MRVRIPFTVKIALSTAALVVISLSIFTYVSFRQYKAMIVDAVTKGLTAVVSNAAPLVEARELEARSPQAASRLMEFVDTLDARNPDIREFRILKEVNGRIVVVVASSGKSKAGAGEGEVYRADKLVLDTIGRCLREKKPFSTGLYEAEQGKRISAFAPISDAEGRVVGVLAADREAAEVQRAEAAAVSQMEYYAAAALAAAALMGVYVSIRITRPLSKLYSASREAREGRFASVEVTGTDEVAALTSDFNETHAALRSKMNELELLNKELEQRVEDRTEQLSRSYEELRGRQQIMQREMTVARRVQETIIPRSIHRERMSIDVEYVPILEIGGDLGIVVEQAADRFDVAVGDVTGHGIGAALVVNRAHTLLTQLYAAGAPLDSLFHRLDYFLAKEIADIGIFLTMSACRFDLTAMTMEYAGGGHLPGILYRPSEGTMRQLASRCGILGTGSPWCEEPPVEDLQIRSGDFVVLFTDGLTEATNSDGQEFGQRRLEETIREAAGKGSDGKSMAKSLIAATKDFTGGYFQDDVLVVVVSIG